jgi:D-xylose transport system ATP-binding protein
MAVGKNITLAALDQFSGALSSLDDAAEQQCILQSLARLKVKTSSPELAIGRLSGGNQQSDTGALPAAQSTHFDSG